MAIINSPGSSGSSTSSDGWVADPNSPLYASATTFTAGSTDLTATYSPGTRIKLTQTTVKYFVVVSSSFGAGTTTVTITGGTDYTLANATISLPFYSYSGNPQGFPGWFAYTPTPTGFTGSPTVGGRFCVNGREVSYLFSCSGTSNATGFTLTLPIAAVATTGVDALMGACGQAVDNTITLATYALAFVATAGGTAMSLFKDGTAGNWTNAGTKSAKGSVRYGI